MLFVIQRLSAARKPAKAKSGRRSTTVYNGPYCGHLVDFEEAREGEHNPIEDELERGRSDC